MPSAIRGERGLGGMHSLKGQSKSNAEEVAMGVR